MCPGLCTGLTRTVPLGHNTHTHSHSVLAAVTTCSYHAGAPSPGTAATQLPKQPPRCVLKPWLGFPTHYVAAHLARLATMEAGLMAAVSTA